MTSWNGRDHLPRRVSEQEGDLSRLAGTTGDTCQKYRNKRKYLSKVSRTKKEHLPCLAGTKKKLSCLAGTIRNISREPRTKRKLAMLR
jgi:hypothetical protein